MIDTLKFRRDFGEVRENWRRFWEGTLGRPILLAEPPKAGVEPVSKPPWGAAFTRDYDGLVEQVLRWAETHEFLGDAVPFFTPSLIIDLMPAFLGAEIVSVSESWGTDTHAQPSREGRRSRRHGALSGGFRRAGPRRLMGAARGP